VAVGCRVVLRCHYVTTEYTLLQLQLQYCSRICAQYRFDKKRLGCDWPSSSDPIGCEKGFQHVTERRRLQKKKKKKI